MEPLFLETIQAEKRKFEDSLDVEPKKEPTEENTNTEPIAEAGQSKKSGGLGFAKIKEEYIVTAPKKLDLTHVSKTDKDKLTGLWATDKEPPPKKLRGQNVRRHKKIIPIPRSEKLCLAITQGKECPYGKECLFSHDIEAYLKAKPEDIGPECYLFKTIGNCFYGASCRFGSEHLSSDYKAIINEELWSKFKDEVFLKNELDKGVLRKLRKRDYDFSSSKKILSVMKEATNHEEANSKAGNTPRSMDSILWDVYPGQAKETSEEKPCGPVLDLSALAPREIKKIDFSNKLYVAPLTTVGNLPFRRICKKFGADITCGEMSLCVNLLQGHLSEWALMKRHQSEDIFGVQICGSQVDVMTKCAQVISETMEVDFVDINVGCPIDLIYRKGAGCGLMNRYTKFETIVKGLKSVLTVPLTAKIRTGVYQGKNIAHQLIPRLKDWGIDMITMHGRSREQRFTKSADWSYINECAELASPIPFFGNGDILSYEEYNKHMSETKISGAMLARGALIKPWLCTEIKEQRVWDISSRERLDIVRDYVHYGLEHWGSDSEGVDKTRKFLLEWLSFLHRYIPVGVLEVLPQRINERPPSYHGRDELETLLSSPSCSDWVKISEMFLGPVSSDFEFLPKHKANAFK